MNYEFQVRATHNNYNVYRHGDMFVLDFESGQPTGCSYLINDHKDNWINITEWFPIESKPKEPTLTLPLIYRNKHFPEDIRLLIRGSEGKVSCFEEGLFAADEWTDEQVIQNIIDGVWLVQSVGNVSFGGE